MTTESGLPSAKGPSSDARSVDAPSVHALTANDLQRLLGDALTLPAPEGARVLALWWLHQLETARAQWKQVLEQASRTPSDAAGSEDRALDPTVVLHKARVALRRLRATLRENARVLDGVAGRRVLRDLRRLGRATNAARDTDVQREWLEAHGELLDAPARLEAEAMIAWLASAPRPSPRTVDRAFARLFDTHVDALRSRLLSYKLRRMVGRDSTGPRFALHLALRLQQSGHRLRRELAQGTAIVAQDVLHELRIRLKRQRALLAPFAKSRPALGAWFDLATRAQDQLGAMRDAMVLADLAKDRSSPALEAALRSQALAHFAAFSSTWHAQGADTLAVLDRAAQALQSEGSPQTANGLPQEIERKYLLRALPPEARQVPPTRIDQGWIPGTALRERLRRSTRPDGSVRCTRTIKFGPTRARVEIEEATSDALFEAMWPLTREARIRKLRHAVPHGEHVWEIDVFLDRELVLAEVELRHSDEHAPLPPWLAPYVERDVTDDPAYLNAVMARPDA